MKTQSLQAIETQHKAYVIHYVKCKFGFIITLITNFISWVHFFDSSDILLCSVAVYVVGMPVSLIDALIS